MAIFASGRALFVSSDSTIMFTCYMANCLQFAMDEQTVRMSWGMCCFPNKSPLVLVVKQLGWRCRRCKTAQTRFSAEWSLRKNKERGKQQQKVEVFQIYFQHFIVLNVFCDCPQIPGISCLSCFFPYQENVTFLLVKIPACSYFRTSSLRSPLSTINKIVWPNLIVQLPSLCNAISQSSLWPKVTKQRVTYLYFTFKHFTGM